MKKKVHCILYIIFLLISIVLIGLYFIKPSCSWCIVSCSVGASLIGAVVLGWCIDWRNEVASDKQNKKVFQLTNSGIYTEINYLLMNIYRGINELNELLLVEKTFNYKDVDLENLLGLFAKTIEKINKSIDPMVASSEVAPSEDTEYMRRRSKALKILAKYNDSLQEYRKKFDLLKEKFEINKGLLLVNDVGAEKTIYMLSAVLGILGTQKNNNLAKESELIEYGQSLQELIDCNLISALNAIGFDKVKFNNTKGYFDIEFVEGKHK